MTNQHKACFEITGSLLKTIYKLSTLLNMDDTEILVSAITLYNKCYTEILKGSKIKVYRPDGKELDYFSVYFDPIKNND